MSDAKERPPTGQDLHEENRARKGGKRWRELSADERLGWEAWAEAEAKEAFPFKAGQPATEGSRRIDDVMLPRRIDLIIAPKPGDLAFSIENDGAGARSSVWIRFTPRRPATLGVDGETALLVGPADIGRALAAFKAAERLRSA